MPARGTLGRRALIGVLLVWLGVVIGVSLLAAPVPFMVEQLERAEALAVNRQLFRMLSRAELVLLALAVLAAFLGRLRSPWVIGGIALVAVAVLVQVGVLQPELARRTDLILAGHAPEPGPWHGLYVGLELLKLAVLPALALAACRGRHDP